MAATAPAHASDVTLALMPLSATISAYNNDEYAPPQIGEAIC
jgi:hypothetical protein